jgi:hypothetical protein
MCHLSWVKESGLELSLVLELRGQEAESTTKYVVSGTRKQDSISPLKGALCSSVSQPEILVLLRRLECFRNPLIKDPLLHQPLGGLDDPPLAVPLGNLLRSVILRIISTVLSIITSPYISLHHGHVLVNALTLASASSPS